MMKFALIHDSVSDAKKLWYNERNLGGLKWGKF